VLSETDFGTENAVASAVAYLRKDSGASVGWYGAIEAGLGIAEGQVKLMKKKFGSRFKVIDENDQQHGSNPPKTAVGDGNSDDWGELWLDIVRVIDPTRVETGKNDVVLIKAAVEHHNEIFVGVACGY
jgi:hypothetical protein